MRDGDVVLMTSFTAWAPDARASFKCKADEVSFFLLLGVGSRKYPGTFDPAAALHKLGWLEEPGFNEAAEREAFNFWFYASGFDGFKETAWAAWEQCAKRKAGVL